MKKTKMTAIVVMVLCLMVWPVSVASGAAQSLTVNGQPVKSITLEVGQSCTFEVVSDDSISYTDYVGFDNRVVRGTFLYVETMPAAGDSAAVTEYNDRAFYGYYVVADGFKLPPGPGVHFVFEYEAQQVGETDLKLYQNDPPPLAGPLSDSVHITVIPAPMGTAITYQGSLNDTGSPADGFYDFQFKLYDSITGGNQEGNTIDINDVDVIEGQFVVELDFGSDPNIFNGDARWLQVGVRPGDSIGVHIRLSPRIELMPTPYAIYAKNAGDDGDWAVSGNDMYSIPSGRVGIGTTTPAQKFEVGNADETNNFVRINSNSWGGLLFYDGEGPHSGGISYYHPADALRFQTRPSSGNPAERMRITSNGNIGIGTFNPLAGLHLRGTGHPSSFMYLQSDANEDTGFRLYEGTAVKWHLFNDSDLDGLSLRNNAYSPVLFARQSTGNVGIGTTNPEAKLDVDTSSDVAAVRGSRGIRYGFLAGTDSRNSQWGVYGEGGSTWGGLGGSSYGVYGRAEGQSEMGVVGSALGASSTGVYGNGTGYGVRAEASGSNGTGLWAKGGTNGYAGYFDGDVRVKGNLMIYSGGTLVMELGSGLDYAEGFDVSANKEIGPGTVLIIDAENPGKLAMSDKAYDSKVAGIVAGGKGLGSGVRLGTGEFDHDVALAGRVYCNVDTTKAGIEPGDLLTTSTTPGYAMKATDYMRAQGAILGKAMEGLEKGHKGQILVLVTLQ